MGERRAWLFRGWLPALVVLACACSQAAAVPRASPSPQLVAGCRTGEPLAGVHHPERLQVLDRCKHAEGTVVTVALEDDGDYRVWFKPDTGYEALLNAQNHFQAQPAMPAAITPNCDLAGFPADAQAAARCPKSSFPIPSLGDHIAIDGPWVLDTEHGWREIHPVNSIQIR